MQRTCTLHYVLVAQKEFSLVPGVQTFAAGWQFLKRGMEKCPCPEPDYRVGLVVWQLGWDDLDLECSTILLGQ